MNWKTILALAVLVAPLAWCSLEERRAYYNFRLECAKIGGKVEWGHCVVDAK